jgi:hypothetical protein
MRSIKEPRPSLGLTSPRLGVIMTRHDAWALEQDNRVAPKELKPEYAAQHPAAVLMGSLAGGDGKKYSTQPNGAAAITPIENYLDTLAAPGPRAATHSPRTTSVAPTEFTCLPPALQYDAVEEDWQLVTATSDTTKDATS